MGCGNSIPSPDDEEHLHTVVNGSTITGTPPRQCQGRADVSKMEGQLPPATTPADAPCTQASGEKPVVAKGSATGPFRDESFPAAQSSQAWYPTNSSAAHFIGAQAVLPLLARSPALLFVPAEQDTQL